MTPTTPTDKIYCYVTTETCNRIYVALPDEHIHGVPVAEHGDYTAWTMDEDETLAAAYGTGYTARCARRVLCDLNWPINLQPIWRAIKAELGDDIAAWVDLCFDEADIAKRNGFNQTAIIADIRGCWDDEQGAEITK